MTKSEEDVPLGEILAPVSKGARITVDQVRAIVREIKSEEGRRMVTETTDDQARLAAEAHTNLTVFHAVIRLLEGGSLYGARPQRPAQQIIKLCQRAAQSELAAYDRARSAINGR